MAVRPGAHRLRPRPLHHGTQGTHRFAPANGGQSPVVMVTLTVRYLATIPGVVGSASSISSTSTSPGASLSATTSTPSPTLFVHGVWRPFSGGHSTSQYAAGAGRRGSRGSAACARATTRGSLSRPTRSGPGRGRWPGVYNIGRPPHPCRSTRTWRRGLRAARAAPRR